jgi:isochorismate hydrolase
MRTHTQHCTPSDPEFGGLDTRFAFDHGYHVVLATDAMTDTDPDAHANSIERIFSKFGETTTTAEILDMPAETK